MSRIAKKNHILFRSIGYINKHLSFKQKLSFESQSNMSGYMSFCCECVLSCLTGEFFSCLFLSSKSRRSQPSTSSSQAVAVARSTIAPGDDGYMRLAMDTIDELEWCLEQLETVQTHRSVSDMASLKVSMRSRLLILCVCQAIH